MATSAVQKREASGAPRVMEVLVSPGASVVSARFSGRSEAPRSSLAALIGAVAGREDTVGAALTGPTGVRKAAGSPRARAAIAALLTFCLGRVMLGSYRGPPLPTALKRRCSARLGEPFTRRFTFQRPRRQGMHERTCPQSSDLS